MQNTVMSGTHFAELWDSVPAGLLVVDEGLRIIAFNKAWSSLCDVFFPKKLATGMPVADLMPDEAPVRLLDDALHGKTARLNGFSFEAGDGRYFDLTAVPAAGGALLMAVDSTDHGNSLKAVDAARSEAEFYVDLMSHDIRNFNQVTMGYIELLQLAESLTPGELAYLEKAQKGVAGSNRLIDNIKKIRMIRQFAGKNLVKTDLNDVLAQDIEAVKKASPSATISLGPKKKHLVMADDYVHDIFRHIMENSVKYDPHPEKRIDVSIQPAMIDGRDFWSVRIADHGTGVPEDKKKSIFERMTRTTKGAGVGLSIVGVIVDKYGGRIHVEDRVQGDPSKGSVFVVDLPQA